tara:strand:+ start:34 stop:396 length:363 start_codon:yes stop_codon:yes gene_type:complete
MKDFLISGLILFIIDIIWIKLFMGGHFQKLVKNIQGETMTVKNVPAFFAYLFLVIAFYYFIILQKKSYLDAFILGIVIYGVYEGTNFAIFKKWNWTTFFLDTLWGGILFVLTLAVYNSLT